MIKPMGRWPAATPALSRSKWWVLAAAVATLMACGGGDGATSGSGAATGASAAPSGSGAVAAAVAPTAPTAPTAPSPAPSASPAPSVVPSPAPAEPALAEAVLQTSGFPLDFNLGSVERLYKSAAYKVEVRPSGTQRFTENFVFETRNDWVLYDFFNADPGQRSKVLRRADQTGFGKADLRTASFTQFMFSNTAVDVRVTLLDGRIARTATVRPLRRGIAPRISGDGKVISFQLSAPQKVALDINDRLDPLFVFGDTPDEPDLSATHYFGPGVHRLPGDGTLRLKSNERVYIAAGAVVEGRFVLNYLSRNVTIRGRGLLSGGEWLHPGANDIPGLKALSPVASMATNHLLLEGITLVQSPSWQVAIEDFTPEGNGTFNNQYRNLKTISWNGNTDGIWVTGNNNLIDDVFIFNNDDALVTKGGANTRITNVVWQGGVWGRLLHFYDHLDNTAPIDKLVVERVDVIGKEGQDTLINLSSNNTKPITNIQLRDVRVEERRRDTNTNNSPYNMVRWVGLDGGRNANKAINNMLFEDIRLDQKLAEEGWIYGSASQPFTGFVFKNFVLGGNKALSASDANIKTNAFVELNFVP